MRRRHDKLFHGVQENSCTPATWRTGEREGNPSHSMKKSAPKALRLFFLQVLSSVGFIDGVGT